jgi:stearoyl-CoA desaturase (delta-9 desaturase)
MNPARPEHTARRRFERAVACLVVTAPVAGVALALALPAHPTRIDLSLLLGFYLLTMLGLTAGLHRLFSHRSYQASLPVKLGLAIAAGMAIEGPIVRWVAQHRRHHAHSDRPGDPHSPVAEPASSPWRRLRALGRAHVGWMLAGERIMAKRYAPDLLRDPAIRVLDRLYPLWVLMSLALPAMLGHLAGGSASSGFLWGSLVRIAFVHQASWAINSLGHSWGSRPFLTGEGSRNNALLAVLTLGEGWHNNHHAFPTSARHGLHRWQLDPTAAVIEALARLRLASDVKHPEPKTLVSKERKAS